MDPHQQKDEPDLMDVDLKEELMPIFNELEAAIEQLRQNSSEDDCQVNVCLSSRSAFTDFFSLSVLQHRIDPWAKTELERLFHDALELLPQGTIYRGSVEDRFNEFQEFCIDVQRRDPLDTSDWSEALMR